MKRHIAILAFGIIIAAGATFSQISSAAPGLASASSGSKPAAHQLAPTTSGSAASVHGVGQDD